MAPVHAHANVERHSAGLLAHGLRAQFRHRHARPWQRDGIRPSGVDHVPLGGDVRKERVGVVVRVQYCGLRLLLRATALRQGAEEARLRVPVRLVTAMEVQVLVCDVRDDRNVELDGGHPVLREAMRGRFEDCDLRPGISHLRQEPLHVGRIRRRGVEPGIERVVADDGVDRRYHPRARAARFQDAVDEIGGGRFAVCAGDADDRKRSAGVAEPGRMEPGEGRAAVRNGHGGDVDVRLRLLHDDRGRATSERICKVPAAVDADTLVSDKKSARGHLARV